MSSRGIWVDTLKYVQMCQSFVDGTVSGIVFTLLYFDCDISPTSSRKHLKRQCKPNGQHAITLNGVDLKLCYMA